jgi:hypothetical protein
MGHAREDPRHSSANEAGEWLFERRVKDEASTNNDQGSHELSMMNNSGHPGGGMGGGMSASAAFM